MISIQTHLEVKGAVQQWVESFMQQHRIPATTMADALTSALLPLKDKAVQEMLEEAYSTMLAAQDENSTSTPVYDEEETIDESDLQD